MTDDIAYFNGIAARTGQYVLSPRRYEQLTYLARGEPPDSILSIFLRRWWERVREPHLGLIYGVNPLDISQAQWGVIFHQHESKETRAALTGLIEHRHGRIFEYHAKETKDAWLLRHNLGPGQVNPKYVPYYLLIVGAPGLIPFSFQYQLDVQYAVGRICFDTPAQYQQYTESIVRYERGSEVPTRRSFAVFAPSHPGDPATQLSASKLANPIATQLSAQSGWPCLAAIGDTATKQTIETWVTAADSDPALIFAACHGLGFDANDAEQAASQGAWLCRDWPEKEPVRREHVFGAADLIPASKVFGKVIFNFSCFGAGTPETDEFADPPGTAGVPPARRPFVSALPQRLLSHPGGGALAFVGHVDRAWSYSFAWAEAGAQPQTYLSALGRILAGEPVGHAMNDFNLRYAEISTLLVDALAGKPKPVSNSQLTRLWLARNDARNYIVIGDPAVRLRPNVIGAVGQPGS